MRHNTTLFIINFYGTFSILPEVCIFSFSGFCVRLFLMLWITAVSVCQSCLIQKLLTNTQYQLRMMPVLLLN